MRRSIIFFAALLLLQAGNVFAAYELPHAFWAVNDRYASALQARDDWQIIEFAAQALEIIQNEPENEQVMSIRATRLEQMALAYERQTWYPRSAELFGEYIYYAGWMGWADAVKIAQAKILQYTTTIDLFTPVSEPQSYYGARLEPERGILYGMTADSATRQKMPEESMTLLYLEFGDTNFGWIESVLSAANNKGIAVELAWNLPGEGSQIPQVVQETEYIVNVLRMLNKYPRLRTFIRFGAEMNIWSDRADPAQFIQAFRHVADLARQHTTNTAMVWSVNTVSSWDIHMEDYYPGDEYVDWVGVSLYMKQYFLGRNDWPENEKFNEVVFLSGANADPVRALDEVVRKFGGRKPIMLAESGASHRCRALGEDTTEFALEHLKQLYYNVPMVYPQVKLIAYFDRVIEHESEEYALTTSPQLEDLYLKLIRLPHFIQKSYTNIAAYQSLRQGVTVTDGMLPVNAYVHIYKAKNVKVDYYIDGAWAAGSGEIPYSCNLDFSGLTPGAHEVKAVVEYEGGSQAAQVFSVNVEKDISLYVNGKKLATDVAPMLVQDRTFVPVRVVSEALDAKVEWEEETQTVTLKRGAELVQLQIGNLILRKDGVDIPLDVAPFLESDRTMVPVRAISEAFQATVDWNGHDQSVWIQLD